MKNIEIIIKYLSGELLSEENDKFMKEVREDPELRHEFESVSSIWNEIKEQLTLKDGPGSLDREALIAEILAEHDVQFYKHEPESKKELDFREKMEEAMNESAAPKIKKRKINPRIISMISMAAAAAIIAFVVILNPPPDLYELTDQYYQPASDAVFESISNTSRSDVGSAMAQFRQGEYATARSISHDEMLKQPELPKIQLLYALSCYETGDLPEAETSLIEIARLYKDEIAETSNWYLALIYTRSNREVEAKLILEELAVDSGTYKKQAKMLLRKMK